MLIGTTGETKLNDFKTDLEYSLESGEDKLFDNFYYRIFPTLKSIEKVVDKELQLKGIDKILIFESGKKVLIDEKKRRKDYGDIAIEIYSNTEKKTPGWVYKPLPDYFVYAIMPTKKVYLLPALLLKLWVEDNFESLDFFPKVEAKNPGYITTSYAVPPDILLEGLKGIMNKNL